MDVKHRFKLNSVVVYLDPNKEMSGLFRVTETLTDCNTEPFYELEDINGNQIEVEEHFVFSPLNIDVCPQCGYFHVETKGWVDINTKKYIGDVGDIDYRFYCEKCEDSIEGVVTAEDYYEGDIEILKAQVQ